VSDSRMSFMPWPLAPGSGERFASKNMDIKEKSPVSWIDKQLKN
jgi:hypothetical protein